ncbi:NAD(P)H-hydrate dehydratase [Kroppenstedtia pulmonis]|uniref:Bifunctional NAD(P)H-hydrate repair enzyme n=1 Tax=Kroppenstedtia pulmonis TaxID=1380685 RepID=A0A7D4CWZ6_9BACL|nr:NAD(P)H-hydrate dehydratase [Kroppenstedtia pulmonis]QKG85457.1 NAD(P)H-hydrate dehydratase [Kroppenstedtia pulmonis]
MYLFTAQEMRDLDRYTIMHTGIPGTVLMENAGRGVAHRIQEYVRGRKTAVVLAGSGNNGGDGFVVARYLVNAGWNVFLWRWGSVEQMSEETRTFYQVCENIGLKGQKVDLSFPEELTRQLEQADVVVDALLGTGIQGPLRQPMAELIHLINRKSNGFVVAVDLPSGVNTDTGAVETDAVQADLTVALAAPKWCHYLYPGADYCGELVVEEIGIPKPTLGQPTPRTRLNLPAIWESNLTPRSRWSHKGHFGHLLVVGGSRGMAGAVALAGSAALRAGAGLVTIAVPRGQEPILATKVTEAMVWGWPDNGLSCFTEEFPSDWSRQNRKWKTVVVGPGLGRFQGEQSWLKRILLEVTAPIVLDADALNILSHDSSVLKQRQGLTVLTPHPGEMARLTKQTVQQVEANRFRIAVEWAKTYGVIVVLKGTHTIIAYPDGTQWVNPTGTPALAKGGSGDILAGMLGSFLVQGIPPEQAVPIGVYLHGLAGEKAVSSTEQSVLATEVIASIGPAIHQFL